MNRPSACRRAAFAIGLLAVACHQGEPCRPPVVAPVEPLIEPPVEPPVEPPDAASPSSPNACKTFCTRAAVLNCPGKTGSPGPNEILGDSDDVPCQVVCRNVVASGVYKTSGITCFNQAATCARLDTCLMGD